MAQCKIIIVGENNLCRSFMGEAILRGLLQKKAVSDIEVISRGLVVLFSEPVSPIAAALLREHGYVIEEFRSSQLTQEELDSADLVLTMTGEQTERIRTDFDTQTTCMSIGTFIDMEEEIPVITEDTRESYENCFTVLEQLMEAVADRVIGELLPMQ
ncbi:MAG: hypothetical protein PUH88_03735 [Lachnospiraceae bacterium]|nr:hypothetical protein [Eubacterium sp.]MDD7113569.1 hypothetical protein [Lachnospiraceae bacterium]